MKCPILLFLSLLLILTQCIDLNLGERAPEEPECIDPEKINKEAVCYMIYKPVCGCDGISYSNDCIAQNNGVMTWTEGECEKSGDTISL